MANRSEKSGNTDRFYFPWLQNPADCNCCHELKTLTPWKKSYDKPGWHIKKQRLHFDDKHLSSQSYGFCSSRVQMWDLDYKEGRKTKNWHFQSWCWRRHLSPLDSKEIRPVNPKGIFIEYLLEGLMLKLKLQYFGHFMRRANSLDKTLMLGKIEDKRRRWWQRMRGLNCIIDSVEMSLSKLRETVKDREAWCAAVPWCAAVHGVAKSWTWWSDWTTICHEVMGPDAMILVFFNEFWTSLFTLLFHIHQEAP